MKQRFDLETTAPVIGGFYDAAFGQISWPEALHRFSNAMQCARSCIFHIEGTGCNAISDIDDLELNSCEAAQILMRDPLWQAYAMTRPGQVYRREDLIDEDALRNRPLWTELLQFRDMARDLIFTLPNSRDDDRWTVQMHRGRGQGEFSSEEIAFFSTCVPHLARAGEIGRTFKETHSLVTAFSDLSVGMALVDVDGKVAFLNAKAETQLSRAHSSLTLRRNKIICIDPKRAQAFDSLMNTVLYSDGMNPGGSMILNPGCHSQLVVTIAPHHSAGIFGTPTRTKVMILLRGVGPDDPRLAIERMGDFLQFTPSEARLGLALASGSTLKDAVADNNITLKTGRTYLERMYLKTGVGQQSQLVALIKSLES